MIIRAAERSDIPAIFMVEQQAHLSPWSEKLVESSFTPRSHNYIYCVEDKVLGYYFSEFVAGEMTLQNICVASQMQGKGIATRLMTHLIEQASTLKAEDIWLEVRESNLPAIKLYQANGFETMGLRKNYYGIPNSIQKEHALLMRLTL